ncbi:nucleotidyltransferase domain-containing protein [Cysteiniphilum sp. 6C5]|uniref:nucleotidyltransferase domain-containing protein n=1 Tax=unclassified Cysteiniphilum TaxID=2610889 RepID=UPI003F87CF1A
MPYGLTDKTFAAITHAISQQPKITKAILYGSRAKGNYHTGSDIDLTLIGDDLTVKDLFQLEEAIDALFLPYLFDLSIYAQLNNPALKSHIDRNGITLFSR